MRQRAARVAGMDALIFSMLSILPAGAATFTVNSTTGTEYRAKGFYLSVRVKFHQDTLGLNKKSLVLKPQ